MSDSPSATGSGAPVPQGLSDADAVRSVLRGDADAYADIVHRYLDPVYSALRWRGLSEEDAAEVTRESFLRSYHELGAAPAPLGAHLQGVAAAEAANFHRRRRPTTSYDRTLVEPFRNPKDHAEAVCKSAAWLPDELKSLFFVRHRSRLAVADIARASNRTRGDVREQLREAHAQMRAVLAPDSDYEACIDQREELLLAASGEPDPAFSRHADSCSACRSELQRFRGVFEVVDGVSERNVQVVRKLLDEVTLAARQAPTPRSEERWPNRMLWVALAVTALALGLAIAGVLLSVTPGE